MDRGNIVEYVRNLNNSRQNFPDFQDAHSSLNILIDKLSFEKNADKIAYSVDVVLHENDGIWTFLKEIKGHKPPKVFLENIYSFLELLCQQKKRLSESQTNLLFNYCKDIIQSKTLLPEIKDLGYKLFYLVIDYGSFQFFVQKSGDLQHCVHHLYFNLDKSKSTEKRQIYELIGNVAENHPDVFIRDQNFIVKVFRQISTELPKILKKQDGSGISEVEGMIKCVDGLLRHLADCAEQFIDTLYECFKNVTERNSTKHVALRAVIQIIEKYFDVFAELIKKDYIFWYRLLDKTLVYQNKEDSLAAKKALHEFYPHIAKLLVEKSDTNKTLLKFFLTALRDDILIEVKHKTEVALKNFIYFADACKIQEETGLLNEIFTITMSLLDKYCLSFNELDSDSIFNLSNILHSTSRFLRHLSGEKCNEEYFQILANASVLSISAYAKAPEKMKFLILQPLLETIINVANLNELFLDSFLESIIYPGIVMSCSSVTEGNIDCLKQACDGDNEFSCDDLLTFRDYLPIWKTLLGNLQSHKDRQLIHNINLEGKICDKIINCVLRIIEKLDISMKETDEFDNQEIECLNLLEYDTVPSNVADFNIFINLVELFFELFDKWNNCEQKFHKWIPILIPKLMELATYNDVKFGFYQMLAVVFKYIEGDNDFDKNEVKLFILEELSHLSERPKTDSRACLRMVMSLPVNVVEEVLADVVPALQLAFERGSEDLSLATEALSCLESWYLKVEKDRFRPILYEVIPYLKPFIQSKRFAGETISMTKHEKTLMKKAYTKIGSKSNRKYRTAYLQSEESELDKLQKKLIKFLGKIDTDLWIPVFTADSYVDREAADLLLFTLHFQDMRVDLVLDKFLPRLIDLACNSSDFNTRRDACEAFHSYVIVFLGENRDSHFEREYPQYVSSLFKKIIKAVFRLSTDENTTIQQIFVPLAQQITHYYSRRQNEKIIANAFLEILFESVTSKNDGTYRKFIAGLFKEFVSWSLKPGHDGEDNIKTIVEHICLFCLQPCSYKKLGAAITFNYISGELSRNDKLQNLFWIELFLYFIRNLSTSSSKDCNITEVQSAIDKLGETIRRNFHEFNRESKLALANRRIPKWFDGETLFDVQMWIFEQCYSSNELCRKKCMQILSKLLDGKDGRPELERFIAVRALSKFKNHADNLPNLNDPAMKPESVVDSVISWLSILSANLDCFLWIIDTKPALVWMFEHQDYKLRVSVESFLGFMVDKDLKTYTADKFPLTSGQKKQFDVLKEEIIYMVLKVASFSEQLSHSFFGEEKMFMRNFQSTFIKCLFEPHVILPHKQSKSNLSSMLEKTLENLKNHDTMNNVLMDIYHNEYWKTFSDILDDPKRARTEHRSNPQVLFVLRNCDIIWPTSEMTDLERTIRKIFYYIRHENTKKAIVPDITIVSYFEDYLLFALKARYDSEFHKVADYVFCSEELDSVSGNTKFSHGLHFFNVFRSPILEYLIGHHEEFIAKCVFYSNLDTMKMLLAYLQFASVKKKKDCSIILEHWIALKNAESSSKIDLSDLLKVLEFSIREMDMNKVENLSHVYDWLLDYLRSSDTKVEIIHQILDLLPAFMGFEFCSKFDTKLKEVMRDLRRLQIDSKIKAEGLVVYNKMLNGVSRTGNRILFETVIQIAIDKEGSFQDNISNAMETLMKNSPAHELLKLLDIPWDMFKNVTNEVKLRIGSMELFLIPMVLLLKEHDNEEEEFYADKMKFICKDLQLKIDNGNKLTENLVSLIGAVIMLETYYKVMANPDSSRIKAIVFTEDEKGSLNSKFAKIVLPILRNDKIPIRDDNEDLVFKLRSHALNAFIAVMQTAIADYPTAQKWGKIIFENKMVWSNVIKLEPPIKLTMTLEQIRSRRKEVIRRRREIKDSNQLSSIATQYATLSSLAPEVSKYDANHFTIRSSQSQVLVDDIELYNEEREIDVLNNHVSMNALCNFVRFLEEKEFLIEDKSEENPKLPDWMCKLLDALKWFVNRPKKFNEAADHLAYQNCVYFVLKFITNCETAFRPFAKFWFSTLMECLYKLNQMNYVITDVVLMLLQWRDRVVPEDRNSATRLFEMFTSKITEHQSSSRNYLLEMMKAMIQVWNTNFDIPFDKIDSLIRSKDKDTCTVGLNIAEYFLQCHKFPFNENNREIILSIFVEKLTDQKLRWHNKQVATILGLVLRTAGKNGNGTLDNYYEKLKSTVVTRLKILNNSAVKTVDSFCLMEHLIVHYPPMLEDFSYHFLQRFNNLQGSYKRNCLKVLTNNVKHVPDDAFSNLFSCDFESALKTNDQDLSVQALMLIKSFLNEDRIRVRIEDLAKIIDDLRRLSTHETSECRKSSYDVASCIFDKYRNDESDEKAKELVYICKDILLTGLLDTDAELQNEIYKSWERRSNLENSVSDRFLNIIKTMYHPQHEAHFVSYAVDFLLEACASTEDYNSELFPHSLLPCDFIPYQIISISSRSKRLSTLTPCFRNSVQHQLASLGVSQRSIGSLTLQINRTPGSSGSTINLSNASSVAKSVRMYSPGSHHPLKYISPVTTTSSQAPSESKPFDSVGRALDRLKKRIIKDSREASSHYAIRNSKLNEETCQMLANQADKRDRKIDLKRQYRRGDFPDIQIKRSDLIKPLQALAKRDPIIAKLLFGNIFLNMVNKMKEKQTYLDDINEAFNAILLSTEQFGSICLETIFEIAYSLPALLKLEIRSVVIASNMNNLLSLRALLLENSLIYGETNDCGPSAPKRARIENSPENDSLWIHLAEVYKSLDRNDVVNGIFKEKIQNSYCELLKRGLEFETVGDWERAYKMYGDEIDQLSQMNYVSQDQRFILDAYYKSAAYLSKWDEMREKIENKFSTVENILQDNWHKECTLPWYFLSQTYEAVKHPCFNEENTEENFQQRFRNEVLEMEKNNDQLFLDLLAEPSSMLLFIYGDQSKAHNLVKRSLELILKEFNFSDSSLQTFLKLQTLSEIDILLSVFNDDQYKTSSNVAEILGMWQRCEPNKDHSTWWDRRLVYRHRFAEKYAKALENTMDESGFDLCKSLSDYQFYSKLQFCEKALNQQNYNLACQYTADIEDGTENDISDENKFMRSLNLCRMYTFRADKKNSTNQIQNAVLEMKKIYEIGAKCEFKTSMAVSNLLNVIKRKLNVWPNDFITSLVDDFPESFDERISLPDKINQLIAENYDTACETAKRKGFSDVQISSAYLALAKHCREVSNETNTENLTLDLQIAKSILNAMKYNSKESYLLFPMLLDLRSVADDQFIDFFINECKKVEEWKFLSWINQLLAYIYHNRAPMIGDLVVRMAQKYPKAFHFPFLLSKNVSETNGDVFVENIVRKIEAALQPLDEIEELIKALSFVWLAEKKWDLYRHRLEKSLEKDDPDTIYENFTQVQKEIRTYGGTFWPYIDFQSVGDRLRSGQREDEIYIKEKLKKYMSDIEYKTKYDKSPTLSCYSRVLLDFINTRNATIEIPGQYDGFSLPRVERHVKIFGFQSKVTKMDSLQSPMKITVLGDDAKEYSYLVKMNEDVRQDQRIQQLFHIVNQSLTSKFHLYSKHLILNTFGVYPLRCDLGLIEWVEDSIPLKGFPNIGLKKEQKTKNEAYWHDIRKEYDRMIVSKNIASSGSDYEPFNVAVRNYVSDEKKKRSMISEYQNAVQKIPEDIYKKALMLLTTTPHLFWRLRNQFMANYSAMCIASWILGIGDRHLDNILVSLKSGTCIGIDFGLAFGTGTDVLSIPELIPFRMTPHITSIMAPFDLTGLIRETMIEVLQTLRENDYVLLATMPVFILDPSIDWRNAARKLFPDADKHNNQDESYFENKIKNVKLKLEGCHPSKVTVNELRVNQRIKNYCSQYEALVTEATGFVIGSDEKLTTEEQVDRLLKIATHRGVLATSYSGLETWI
ncbi:DNA-dependent protein kinase catalytic subunit-like [Planococcus citri]|uniref:DNA-dependent protein kinase catalytic subunit-like n=1 Tax=Planococcus citri TaxID=170843 RepID=UPI0031F9AD77